MGENKGGRRNKPHSGRHLARRLAHEVIRDLKLQGPYDYGTMYEPGFDACRGKVKDMRPEPQGLILSYGARHGGNSGRTSMFEVHGTGAFNRHAGGREILVQGAATVVMACVMDILDGLPRETQPTPRRQRQNSRPARRREEQPEVR